MEKVFFKHVIVSDEIDKEKSHIEKLLTVEELKRFRIELVAEDCEQYIKDIIGKDVVLDFSNIKKIKSDEDRNYYICQQSNIIML